MAAVSARELRAGERARVAQLEAVIERGLETFVEVGLALAEIRDGRLYRDTHSTFEAYLHERWGMSRSRGYRLIDGAGVAQLVSPSGDIANEAQARELVPMLRDEGEEQVVEVWRELRNQYGGAVTADRIRRLVRRRLDRDNRARARTDGLPAAPAFGDITLRVGDFRELDVEAESAGHTRGLTTRGSARGRRRRCTDGSRQEARRPTRTAHDGHRCVRTCCPASSASQMP